MFEVDNLSFSYDGHEVIQIARMGIDPLESVALVGDNGSGKSTLLQLFAGLLEGYSGGIRFGGEEIAPIRSGRGVPGVVYVHQEPYLFRGSVARNLRLSGIEDPRPLLETFGLSGFEGRYAKGLSGGERKRVAIARAFAKAPLALLLDEPTAGVDARNRTHIERVLARRGGAQIIFSTHDLSLAYRHADRVVTLRDGRLAPDDATIVRGISTGTDASFTYFVNPNAPGSVIRALAARGEFIAAVIPRSDVLLSLTPLDSSAQNRIRGVVSEIQDEGNHVDVVLDCGFNLSARISHQSRDSMSIRPGSRLYAIFKASAVRLY